MPVAWSRVVGVKKEKGKWTDLRYSESRADST